jgi:hypothetical protein
MWKELDAVGASKRISQCKLWESNAMAKFSKEEIPKAR